MAQAFDHYPAMNTITSDERTGAQLRFRFLMLLFTAVLCTNLTGCMFRRMTIRSDPVGALVMVDGEEVGYTPCSVPFTYYGTREIKLIKPGYETLSVMQPVSTPWYQYFPLEFVTDNLTPTKITDRRDFYYRLQPQQVVPTNEVYDRARALRSESQIRP